MLLSKICKKEKIIALNEPSTRIPINDLESISYHHSIDEIENTILQLEAHDIFFEPAFFKALENHPPKGMFFRYIIIWEDSEPIGLLYFQVKKINLKESLAGSFTSDSSLNAIKKAIAGVLNFYTIVNGNMLQTGHYGHFNTKGTTHLSFESYKKIISTTTQLLKREGYSSAALLCKDLDPDERYSQEECREYGMAEFSVQPNMKLNIRDHWFKADDYLQDLKSKYKVRTRRALKKLNGIEKRELNLAELELYKDRMHELYKYIAYQANFNLFELSPLYFYSLKEQLKDKIKVIGYFLKDQMVGFYTIIYNYETLDAHFLGYDSSYNRDYHLYHNMLYDLLFEAIEKGSIYLNLSRTAMEIKSSIGASAYPMYLYLKTFNPVANMLTPRVLHFLTPQTEWEERNPFKS